MNVVLYCSDILDADSDFSSMYRAISARTTADVRCKDRLDIELNQIQATALHAVALDACWRHGWSERGNAASAISANMGGSAIGAKSVAWQTPARKARPIEQL